MRCVVDKVGSFGNTNVFDFRPLSSEKVAARYFSDRGGGQKPRLSRLGAAPLTAENRLFQALVHTSSRDGLQQEHSEPHRLLYQRFLPRVPC